MRQKMMNKMNSTNMNGMKMNGSQNSTMYRDMSDDSTMMHQEDSMMSMMPKGMQFINRGMMMVCPVFCSKTKF